MLAGLLYDGGIHGLGLCLSLLYRCACVACCGGGCVRMGGFDEFGGINSPLLLLPGMVSGGL